MKPIFPNPASAMTCIPVVAERQMPANIQLIDVYGRVVEQIANEQLQVGENQFFIDASKFSKGVYFVNIDTENGHYSQKIVIF
jgi:hypothetical protein